MPYIDNRMLQMSHGFPYKESIQWVENIALNNGGEEWTRTLLKIVLVDIHTYMSGTNGHICVYLLYLSYGWFPTMNTHVRTKECCKQSLESISIEGHCDQRVWGSMGPRESVGIVWSKQRLYHIKKRWNHGWYKTHILCS